MQLEERPATRKRGRAQGSDDASPGQQVAGCQEPLLTDTPVDGLRILRGHREDVPVRPVRLTAATVATCGSPAAPSLGDISPPPADPSPGGSDNLVWHAIVVAGAMARLTGAVSESLAPTGTDQAAWDAEVRELARAANLASRGAGPAASSLLLDVLGELHQMARPLPREFNHVTMTMALLHDIVKARATANSPGAVCARRRHS